MAGGVNDRNKDSSGLVRRQVDLPRAVHLLGLRAPRSAFPTQDFFSLALSLSKTSNIPLSLIPRSRGLASTIASRQRRVFEPVCGSHPLPIFAQPDNSKHIDQWTAKKHPLISSHIVGDASRQSFDAIAKPVAEAIAIAQWPLTKCPVGAGYGWRAGSGLFPSARRDPRVIFSHNRLDTGLFCFPVGNP